MRIFNVAIISMVVSNVEGSTAVADLALLARAPSDHPVVGLPAVKSVPVKSLVSKSDAVKATTETENPLDLWRVRFFLLITVAAIVFGLSIAVMQTARVFGLVPEPKEPAPPQKTETDPESLTRLLSSQSIHGYGAIFASRGLFGASSSKDDGKQSVIIQ